MSYLIIGLVIWVLVHFIPTLAPTMKKVLLLKFGEKGYKLFFAVDIAIALALIIYGWKNTVPSQIYQLSFATKPVTIGLMFVAIILFGAAKYPTRIKNYIRHPQLTGMTLWSVAHLISNGDSRSLILFGTMGIWAILEMFLINKRDGLWIKISPPPLAREAIGLIISTIVYVALVFLHPYLSGVALR